MFIKCLLYLNRQFFSLSHKAAYSSAFDDFTPRMAADKIFLPAICVLLPPKVDYSTSELIIIPFESVGKQIPTSGFFSVAPFAMMFYKESSRVEQQPQQQKKCPNPTHHESDLHRYSAVIITFSFRHKSQILVTAKSNGR